MLKKFFSKVFPDPPPETEEQKLAFEYFQKGMYLLAKTDNESLTYSKMFDEYELSFYIDDVKFVFQAQLKDLMGHHDPQANVIFVYGDHKKTINIHEDRVEKMYEAIKNGMIYSVDSMDKKIMNKVAEIFEREGA